MSPQVVRGLYTDAVRFFPHRPPAAADAVHARSVHVYRPFSLKHAMQAKRDAEAISAQEASRSQAITANLARIAKKKEAEEKKA